MLVNPKIVALHWGLGVKRQWRVRLNTKNKKFGKMNKSWESGIANKDDIVGPYSCITLKYRDKIPAFEAAAVVNLRVVGN